MLQEDHHRGRQFEGQPPPKDRVAPPDGGRDGNESEPGSPCRPQPRLLTRGGGCYLDARYLNHKIHRPGREPGSGGADSKSTVRRDLLHTELDHAPRPFRSLQHDPAPDNFHAAHAKDVEVASRNHLGLSRRTVNLRSSLDTDTALMKQFFLCGKSSSLRQASKARGDC